MIIDEKLQRQIESCAVTKYPYEMVGCVAYGEFIELRNVSHHPTKGYQLSAKDKVMLFEMGESLQALVHSHPDLDNKPSKKDIAAQQSCRFPFWIIGTDGQTCTEIREVLDE